MQEVFTLQGFTDGLQASFHLAASPFTEELGEQWEIKLHEEGWEFTEHKYVPGGQDQFNIFAIGKDEIESLILDGTGNKAMCLMNLSLMRKGATYYGKSHCFELVDRAIEEFAGSH